MGELFNFGGTFELWVNFWISCSVFDGFTTHNSMPWPKELEVSFRSRLYLLVYMYIHIYIYIYACLLLAPAEGFGLCPRPWFMSGESIKSSPIYIYLYIYQTRFTSKLLIYLTTCLTLVCLQSSEALNGLRRLRVRLYYYRVKISWKIETKEVKLLNLALGLVFFTLGVYRCNLDLCLQAEKY